jgi:hypothetical protein
MNVAAIFEEDGIYKFVFKLGKEGRPEVMRYNSLTEMLYALQGVNISLDRLQNFVFTQLQRKIKLLAELPGNTLDWVQFAG